MKYMLQVRFNGADDVIGALSTAEQRAVTAEFQALQTLPGILDANQLQPADTATTVRIVGGETHTTPELTVARDAALDGYYLYDAADLATAIHLASRIPATRFGATIEIRPTVERVSPSPSEFAPEDAKGPNKRGLSA
ncbi:MAG TPA: hypothetical protein VMF07_01815 [Solirubrobacteraceae bacterium]|nr:hypothetical protein [Solirubrobacteraceae bacterium]HTX10550.1 hypothetical protein [Solirubrobacteraceae bacterium]